ncbi:4-alpha-glucanotransferase [Desulfotomaculum copahuensis]|uniref:4-alpha-glucanotransferase n=1 Tax=Desulfotomaculum copahuensis TaxID=1838280 RepID=A0A1B7LCZ1_9FIRM|nr:4-alpha-glucanotransferase [Desulfotomaculum copahuensis]OAT80787.1 4-alpha-glucanotransferase [Desulfotomaculum copahuensis]
MKDGALRSLEQLARLYGVITEYRDFTGRLRRASPHALLAVLAALGAPVAGPADIPDALRRRRQELWLRSCEPVVVCRAGKDPGLELRLADNRWKGGILCHLEPEKGEPRQWTCDPAGLPVMGAEKVAGVEYTARRLPLPAGLPPGYYRLILHLPDGICESTLISAPARAYNLPAGTGRIWGTFLPLYALRSDRSWAAGDITDLEMLLHWIRGRGGSLAGTPPMLAAYMDDPFDPSPYAPVSRMFWNEFYLDVTRVPELVRCPQARDLIASPDFKAQVAALRRAPLVDYRRGMKLKRRVLEMLARCCFAAESARLAALHRWTAENPAARDYARFRAVAEQRRSTWIEWPEPLRSGNLRPGDFDPEAERYHLYVQWLAREQFGALADRAREHGTGLYLDFPLGVHAGGYDVWRERDVFATTAACGAPPDALNARGQNWGFPPLHPGRLRERGYRYFIACLRHHMRHAGFLRLDHIMGMHRLYWIPAGLPADGGVYVRYPAEEFYAVLSLESRHHRTVLVGEDLGTVEGSVRETLTQNGIHRMYVLPFEFKPVPGRGLNRVPAGSLACLNTHDMPPFTAFWRQSKPATRAALAGFLYRRGLLSAAGRNVRAVLQGCLKYLAASRARILLVNLEDLWLETAPQNVPGTGVEKPNWRRKAHRNFENFSRAPGVLKILAQVDRLRKRGLSR